MNKNLKDRLDKLVSQIWIDGVAKGYDDALKHFTEQTQKECKTCYYEQTKATELPCKDCGTLLESYTNWKPKVGRITRQSIIKSHIYEILDNFTLDEIEEVLKQIRGDNEEQGTLQKDGALDI